MLELHPNQIPEHLRKYFKPKYAGKPLIRRNTIIWWKRNAMPSSAKDRFTNDFEFIYFFTKSGKYYFKQQKEPLLTYPHSVGSSSHAKIADSIYRGASSDAANREPDRIWGSIDGRNRRCVWDVPTVPSSEPHFAMFPEALVTPMIDAGCPVGGLVLDPFSGMATAGKVAAKLGMNYIGFELNGHNAERSRVLLDAEFAQMRLAL